MSPEYVRLSEGIEGVRDILAVLEPGTASVAGLIRRLGDIVRHSN